MCLTSRRRHGDRSTDGRNALAAALAAVLGGACGRTELVAADVDATGGGNDGGTDVPAAGGDGAASAWRRAGAAMPATPTIPAAPPEPPVVPVKRCLPALFRRASGVPGGSDLVLALGDLNGDRLVDLATLSPSRNAVAIWINSPTRGFIAAGAWSVPSQPIAATIADLNGDGIADIAVADFSAGEVTTLAGLGNGGDFRVRSFAVGLQPRAVVATDLNDDGRLDLVVANQDPNRTDDITLLDAVGGGTFAATGRYGTFPSATALAIGDFNGDGKLDLAAASAAVSSLSVFYHGSFSLPTSRFVSNGTRSIAVGDFDEDGIDDVAVSGVGSVAIFPGSRDNVLGTGPVLSTGAAVDGTASTVVAGDFDADGHIDLAFADGRQLYVFLGTGTVRFQPARPLLATGNDTQPTQLAAGDLDGDGVTDLLVGSVQGQIIELLSTARHVLTPHPTSVDENRNAESRVQG